MAKKVKSDGETKPSQYRGLMEPWKAGQTGNPNGRPKGSRNKLNEDFLRELSADFSALDEDGKQNGLRAIERMRINQPSDYVRVLASLLPKEATLTFNQYEEMTDEQLAESIQELYRIIGPFLAGVGIYQPDDGSGKTPKH